MAIRMTRFGEAAFGQFARGDVILNLSPTQESLLLESGVAVPLENEDVQVVLGGQAAAGSSGGGADWKLVTEESVGDAVRVDTYTDDSGLIWSRNYNPDGSLGTETALNGAMVRTFNYTAGGLGYISSGAVRKSGGAYRVNMADMAAIRTELTALGTAAEAPQFWVQNYDNGAAGGGLLVEWSRGFSCFRGPNAAPLIHYQGAGLADIVAPGGTETNAFAAPAFPSWLRGPKGLWEAQFWVDMPGEVGTKTTRSKLNGSGYLTQSNGNTGNAISHKGLIWAVSATNFQNFGGSVSAASGWGQTNTTSVPAETVIAANLDLTFTGTVQYNDAASDGLNTVNCIGANVIYWHP